MALKFATAVLAAVAVTSSPAFACMGTTVLFSDNFQKADPAWTLVYTGTLNITGGYAQVTPPQGDITLLDYEGMFADSADACVDALSPTVADPTQAVGGLVFGLADSGDFYALLVEEDGYAAVVRSQNNAMLTPVPWKQSAAIKTGGNVTNTLRVTWNGTTGTAYINGQVFSTFTIQPFQNTTFGMWAGGDTGANPNAGATWKFTNVKVTNVPTQ